MLRRQAARAAPAAAELRHPQPVARPGLGATTPKRASHPSRSTSGGSTLPVLRSACLAGSRSGPFPPRRSPCPDCSFSSGSHSRRPAQSPGCRRCAASRGRTIRGGGRGCGRPSLAGIVVRWTSSG
jgi:hypothetical protein